MIHVQLPQFEGPLGLLLYLIRRDEIDIHNIPIHNITTQYLEYIKRMRELDLEVASDFIAMAATLILIKSRVLLPQYNENGELVENTEDPRKELVQKLIEYQKFQEASKELNKRALLGRDIWARGQKEDLFGDQEDTIEIDEGGLFSLISMYRKVVRQLERSVHSVRAKGQSIASRILEIREKLIAGHRVLMSDLVGVTEKNATKILITFLSILELTKMGFTQLFQTDAYGEIYIDVKKPVERNVIERVEEYDRTEVDPRAIQIALEPQRELVPHDVAVQEPEPLIDFDEITPEHPVQEVLNEEHVAVLVTKSPHEEPLPEEVASDEDILQAEREMGFVSEEPVSEPATVTSLALSAKSAFDLFESDSESAGVDIDAAPSDEAYHVDDAAPKIETAEVEDLPVEEKNNEPESQI